jgi:ribulose-5-phosphate 4-epimerase/fuculose-1-phosphate aldolase
MSNTESALREEPVREEPVREEMVAIARSLYRRGYTHGTTGNLSVRLGESILITPTGSSFGFVKPEELARVKVSDGQTLGAGAPSKELPFHLAAYRVRSDVQAVVHLHATFSVALSCLEGLDPADMLPPITPYLVMKVGKLPLVPYYRPGDARLADELTRVLQAGDAALLANHGTILTGKTLLDAAAAAEELEETAKLYFLLNGKGRFLTPEQVAELNTVFRS